MFKELKKILSLDLNYINDYIISKKEDLYNVKKINFYYILIKYILKDSIYIYQIPFMIKTRKIILKNLNKLSFIIKNKYINDKYQYILKTILNLDYYYKKFLYINIDKINILIINEEFIYKKRKSYLNLITQSFNNNDDFNKYFEKCKIENPIIKYIYMKTKDIEKDEYIPQKELNKYKNNGKIIKI